MIISIGYRVNSIRGTQFRIWANKILKEYLLKGYAINQRLEKVERKMIVAFGLWPLAFGKKKIQSPIAKSQ